MRFKLLLATLIPIILIGTSFLKSGLLLRQAELEALRAKSHAMTLELEELRGQHAASRMIDKKFTKLVEEFSVVTGLSLEDSANFSQSEVTAQISQFIDALRLELEDGEVQALESGEPHLVFMGISRGLRQEWSPFVAEDYQLNLEGRFMNLPDFLFRVSSLAQEQRCRVSLGELRVRRLYDGNQSAELQIALPLRAYFLER